MGRGEVRETEAREKFQSCKISYSTVSISVAICIILAHLYISHMKVAVISPQVVLLHTGQFLLD